VLAELVLIEMVVDERAQIEQAAQSPSFFPIERPSARSRREIERRHAEAAQHRSRLLPSSPKKARSCTRSCISGSTEEAAMRHWRLAGWHWHFASAWSVLLFFVVRHFLILRNRNLLE
jgi:hypothetical protein